MDYSRAVVAFGNPGVGKSTLLNTLANRTVHQSGVALDGISVTKIVSDAVVNGILLRDTPGLREIDGTSHNAAVLRNAFATGVRTMLIGVIRADDGRVNADDLATVVCIARSIVAAEPSARGKFIVIVNRYPIKLWKSSSEGTTKIATTITREFSCFGGLESILWIMKDKRIDEEDNMSFAQEVIPSLGEFFDAEQGAFLPSRIVINLDAYSYQEVLDGIQRWLVWYDNNVSRPARSAVKTVSQAIALLKEWSTGSFLPSSFSFQTYNEVDVENVPAADSNEFVLVEDSESVSTEGTVAALWQN
ncbi:hypothetical protein HK098_006451 [Nowakowskiella sp. JEL0407]|nr:hypothetical protein HK098_006451 [Nowakowskiella sp. JEL0407]